MGVRQADVVGLRQQNGVRGVEGTLTVDELSGLAGDDQKVVRGMGGMEGDSKFKSVIGSDTIDGKPVKGGGGLLIVAISRALQVVMKNFAVLGACEMVNGWLERVVGERRLSRDDQRRIKRV